MCGISGIISKKTITASVIKKMTDAIAHRGPDDEGFFFAGNFSNDLELKEINKVKSKTMNVCFGHRRLSIVDLSKNGHQPMSYIDRYWITYNGEIFNYLELKEELEKLGYSFKSETDTEVIMAAYDAWGIDCQNKFNGMWAFALFDSIKETIFLSRDRFGIKPLYYYQDKDNFIFASEIKALLENKNVVTTPNTSCLKEYYNSGAKENLKETPFTNIYRFNFSSYTILNLKNFTKKISETSFWDYKVDTSIQQYNHNKALKYAQKYFFLLKDAVRIRLRANVNIGTTLSGGIDSSSILYLINEIKMEEKKSSNIEAFSTVYNTKKYKDCDESFYINLITSQLGIKSNKIEPNIMEIPKLHTKVIKFWETPGDNLNMSGISIFRHISKSDFKVILEGQGADEQQAGYLYYIINFLYHTPLHKMFIEFKNIKNVQGMHRYLIIGIIFRLMSKIFGGKFTIMIIKMLTGKDMTNYTMHLNNQLKHSCNNSLINLIHYADRRSMMHSIETRLPFMDYRLVEFTAKIPSVYKIHNGWTKYFARLAFDKKLPNEITWRKDKMGWPTPARLWLYGELRNWFFTSVKDSIFINKNIKKLNSNIDCFNLDLRKMIRLLNISVWYELFFKKKNLKDKT